MGILVTAGGIGVVFASGICIQTAFKWFHNFEFDMEMKKEKSVRRGGEYGDKLENISKRIRQ